MQSFLSKTQTIEQMIALVTKAVGRDLLRAYPDIDYLDKFIWLCEKISVNSTTVIKNDIVERLEKQPLIFLQYTINTVICQVSPTVSLSVGVHDLQLAKHSAPVSHTDSVLF